ncbi:Galactose-binding-like protein [Gracilaria domingensis]|nr:Galactose-binding-like protein [Gracilaria domingensis]
MQFLPSLLAVVAAILFHFLLNFCTSAKRPPSEQRTQPNPSSSWTGSRCDPLEQLRLRPRPLASTCIRHSEATSTTLSLQIRPPHDGNFTVFLQPADSNDDPIASTSFTIPTLNNNNSVIYNAERLQSDTSYIAIVLQRTTTCRLPVFTLPENNLVQNPSFETSAKPPFLATRFHERETPRSWTPFYNGGAVRFCGPFVDPFDNTSVHTPRSGNCALLLGPDTRSAWQSFQSQVEMYYGVHQSVRIWGTSHTSFISAWYSTSRSLEDSLQHQCKSCADALSLVISVITEDGQWHDGAIIPLESSIEWTKVCVQVVSVSPISSLHIFFHFHEHSRGHVLVDDVTVTESDSSEGIKHSTCHQIEIQSPPVQRPIALERHLVATVRPEKSQLTIAVPLTQDRILRLEAMSRLYGGGPIVAAVLVRNESEARVFEQVWRRKPWLRDFVDISFVKWGNR